MLRVPSYMQGDKKFIEDERFPVEIVMTASEKEKKGGGRPPFWEMLF